MIKAVIFDMDGLMLDTEILLQRFWCEAANELGFPMEPYHVLGIRSLSRKYAERHLKRVFGDGFDYMAVRARRIELMNAYIEEHCIRKKKGLDELLDYLKDRNIRAAGISGLKLRMLLRSFIALMISFILMTSFGTVTLGLLAGLILPWWYYTIYFRINQYPKQRPDTVLYRVFKVIPCSWSPRLSVKPPCSAAGADRAAALPPASEGKFLRTTRMTSSFRADP